MKTFLKKLSSVLIAFNAVSGFFMLYSLSTNYWYICIPLLILCVSLNLRFYFTTHKIDYLRYQVKLRQLEKTHTNLGCDETGDYEMWENKITKEIVYF